MGLGYLKITATTANGAIPIEGADVVIKDNYGNILYSLKTDASGQTEYVSLYAPDKVLTLSPNFTGIPYSTYRVEVRAPGFITEIRNGVQIFDTVEAIENVKMHPAFPGSNLFHVIDIPPHNLIAGLPPATGDSV